MPNISDLAPLGYAVGLAHGSVQVEQDALDAARVEASLPVIEQKVGTLTTETLDDLGNAGRLPANADEKQALAAQIALRALDMLTTHANDNVAFHERALAIAQESPDVFCVQQFAGDSMVVQTYVSCKADGTGWTDEDQAHLDALAHEPSYAEREYQGLNPDAMQAVSTLQSKGRVCARPELGADTFTVDGATVSGAELAKLAEAAALEPPPLSEGEKIVAALAGSSVLSAATKQELQDAVAQPDSLSAASVAVQK